MSGQLSIHRAFGLLVSIFLIAAPRTAFAHALYKMSVRECSTRRSDQEDRNEQSKSAMDGQLAAHCMLSTSCRGSCMCDGALGLAMCMPMFIAPGRRRRKTVAPRGVRVPYVSFSVDGTMLIVPATPSPRLPPYTDASSRT